MDEPCALEEAFAAFDEQWAPRIVAQVNDYDVKIAKVEGDHPEHAHADTDEFFHVLAGRLTLDLPEHGRTVTLGAGEVCTVPRGVGHRPSATAGTRILLFEPRATVNTGDADAAGTVGSHLSPSS